MDPSVVLVPTATSVWGKDSDRIEEVPEVPRPEPVAPKSWSALLAHSSTKGNSNSSFKVSSKEYPGLAYPDVSKPDSEAKNFSRSQRGNSISESNDSLKASKQLVHSLYVGIGFYFRPMTNSTNKKRGSSSRNQTGAHERR